MIDDFLSLPDGKDDDDFLSLPEVLPVPVPSNNFNKGEPGRPSKYDLAFNEQALRLCLLGHTDKDLAHFFQVSEATLNDWKITKPGFLESIKAGKDDADAKVAQSLYHRALGYSHKDTKFATFMGEITEEREYDKHYPPDTRACELWLSSRRRTSGDWNPVTKAELTGAGGRPLNPVGELDGMTNIEKAARIINILQKATRGESDDDN